MPAVELDCKLAREYTLTGFPGAIAYLLVKAIPDSNSSTITQPLNLGVLIDVSRSMAGKKLQCAKEAARLIIQSLRQLDYISITVFSDKATVIIPRQQVKDTKFIQSQINKIRIQTGTRMYLGLETEISEMCRDNIDTAVNRLILLTDGETEKEGECRRIVEHQAGRRISISCYGIGDRYNEDLLLSISDLTLGRFYHLLMPEQISDHFIKDVDNAAKSVIADSTLTLSLLEDVTIESCFRIFPNMVKLLPERITGSNTYHVNLGNLSNAEISCFGLQLKLPARSEDRVCLADISFSYLTPASKIKETKSIKVFVQYTRAKNLCRQIDREVLDYFNQVNAQALITRAAELIKEGNIQLATNVLVQVRLLTEKMDNTNLTRIIDATIEEAQKKGGVDSEMLKTMVAGGRQTIRIQNPK